MRCPHDADVAPAQAVLDALVVGDERGEFAGTTGGAHPHLVVDHDATADAGAQHQHRAGVDVGQRTQPVLGARGTLAVVGNGARLAKDRAVPLGRRVVVHPLERTAGMGDALGCVDATRHRDGHALVVVAGHRIADVGQRTERSYLGASHGRNLALLDELPLVVHDGVLDEGAADVENEILCHGSSLLLMLTLVASLIASTRAARGSA